VARRVSVPELIGRRAELGALRSGLRELGRLVLIQGDAGVGKTRLVQAFATQARAAGATVLSGGCLQFEADIPYAPFAEALGALPDGGSLLASGDRAGEFRRVADALVAAGEPVALVIEDLHWADASTRDLLLYLHRALADAPVLLVGTHRTDEIGADHPVAALVADLARSPRTERLALEPLDRAEVVELASAILGTAPASDMVEALLARAEGNPFFTEELLAAWPTRGEVPGTVREVVITRLARLSLAAQQLARLASVVGRTVPHDLLAGISPLPATELDTALRELVDHGQLVSAPPDAYAFRHALIQESLYRDLLPGERRHAHARVAACLRDRAELSVAGSAAGVAAELAHHWDAAGDQAEALAASLVAARAAEEGLAPAEAHAHYERALRHWSSSVDLDELLERAAEAASLAGRNQRAVELTQRRLETLDVDGFPERAALAYERLSYQARSAGDWELARRTSERALSLIPVDSPERPRIASWPMALDWLSNRFASAIRRAQDLMPLAESAGDGMALNRCLMALGLGHVALGDVESGLSYLHRQRDYARSAGNPRFIGVGYVNLSEALMWADRFAEALDVAREGVARSPELGFDIYLLPIVGNVIRALAELHRWDEALDSSGDPDDPMFDPFNWIFVDLPRAEILLRRGQLDAAEELLKRTGSVLDGQDDVQYGCELAWLRAILLGQRRSWDEARAAVREGLRLAATAEDPYLHARLVAQSIQLEADAFDDTRTRVSGTPESNLDIGTPLPRTVRMLALAEAERTRLDASDPDAWSRVADVAGPDRYLLGYARFRYAEALLLGRGSRTLASDALASAHSVATTLRAEPLAKQITELASRARLPLGEPAVKPSTSDTRGLTVREAEILEMLGRGLTNAEIAAELFISTKTASVHVSNILRKLGLRSRIQAATLAHRREP
jgi:DNA-binding CsgD family transcriptional regulator/tetratricopeptide (TPR) repeat protein